MNSKELLHHLRIKMPNVNYLCFQWFGRRDDWSGFIFKYGNDDTGDMDEFPLAMDPIVKKVLEDLTLFNELNLKIKFYDYAWTEGVLFIVLKPLTESFSPDIPFTLDPGFKGFCIYGRNHEEFSNQMES